MRQVKIILAEGHYSRSEYDDKMITSLVSSLSDWEDCEDEKYQLLIKNRYELEGHFRNENKMSYDQSIIFLTKGGIEIPQAILKLDDILAEQKARIAVAEKKQAKAEATRIANAAKNKAAKDLRQLAKLQAQYGNISPLNSTTKIP